MLSKEFLKSFKKKFQDKLKEKGFTHLFLNGIKRLFTFENIIIYPITFVLCLVIRLIRPIFFIRFGSLYAEKIGPLASRSEMNLCEQENGLQPKRTESFNIYNTGYSSFKCNNQLFIMWRRILRVYSKSRYFWNVMKIFSFGKEHIIEPTKGSRDIHNLLEKSPIHLSFTKEEIFQAKQDLLRMGISEKDKYVLLINRGQRYLDEALPGNMDLSHNSFRNSSINDFIPAAEMLTAKGNIVVRMGHLVSDLMKTTNSKIIEYDHRGFRTELLDIYLAANCRYGIGSDTGYLAVPGWNFRRPLIYVNFSQLEYLLPWLPSWLFSFKKYWLKSEKRFMKVREMLESGAGRFDSYKQYEKNGIELISNTPQEIRDVVDEMEKRLNGTWQDNEDDDELQRRFWTYFKSSDRHGIVRSRIGAKFLRTNKDLL